jgi:hypothetical protein
MRFVRKISQADCGTQESEPLSAFGYVWGRTLSTQLIGE